MQFFYPALQQQQQQHNIDEGEWGQEKIVLQQVEGVVADVLEEDVVADVLEDVQQMQQEGREDADKVEDTNEYPRESAIMIHEQQTPTDLVCSRLVYMWETTYQKRTCVHIKNRQIHIEKRHLQI